MKKARSILSVLTFKTLAALVVVLSCSVMLMLFIIENYYEKHIYEPVYNDCIESLGEYLSSINKTMTIYGQNYNLSLTGLLGEIKDHKHKDESFDIGSYIRNYFDSKTSEDFISAINYYIISKDGIIEETDYATDLFMDFSKTTPKYWKTLNVLEPGEIMMQPLSFEIRSNRARLFGYIRIDDGRIIEVGVSFKDDIRALIASELEIMKKLNPYIENIELYNSGYIPFGDFANTVTDEDKEIFTKVHESGQPYTKKYSSGRKVFYKVWYPRAETEKYFKFLGYLKVTVDFSVLNLLKYTLSFILTISFILLGLTLSIVNIYNSRNIVRPFKRIMDEIDQIADGKREKEINDSEYVSIKEYQKAMETVKKIEDKISSQIIDSNSLQRYVKTLKKDKDA